MTRYLFDTNHASAVWRKDPRIMDRIAETTQAEFYLCLPVIGELWYMVFRSRRVRENIVEMQLLIDELPIHPYDEQGAMEYGRIRSELRQMGRLIPQIDNQIAAIARAHGFIVLSSDRHFLQIQSLQVEDWLIPADP